MKPCSGPSKLHLKKELTVLRKSRLFRDPETCSSWRSPLSSRSEAAGSCSVNYGTNTIRNTTTTNTYIEFDGATLNSDIPLKVENKRKKIYLYNWGHQSAKSSDSGIKIDKESRQESCATSPKIILENFQKDLENPENGLDLREAKKEASQRRTTKKPRRKSTSRQRTARDAVISKLLNIPSGTLVTFNSMMLNDEDADKCTSEDVQNPVPDPLQKSAHTSQPTSPMPSFPGYGNWLDSSKMLKNSGNGRDGSSYSHTPVSTSSCNGYADQNPSNFYSSDGTAGFDEDEGHPMDLPGRQGCGLPCYSYKRKDRGSGGWYSPSLSDTLRRKGCKILYKRKSPAVHKRKHMLKNSQGLPLLTKSCEREGSSGDFESDEMSTNLGELDLEALSRLDGSIWSNCKSQDGFELASPVSNNGIMSDNRCLSLKYRPKSFQEIVGQNIVTQSLSNAILRERIAPAYLFQGPRGTGKTSVARIFAAALNCKSMEVKKPCGFCRECTDFASGKGLNVREVDATNKKGIDRIRYLLKNMPIHTKYTRYEIFIIDECHMLSNNIWSAFIKFLEDPMSRVVFLFITIDPDNLPRAVLSRCQKYLFPKIKDADIVNRLKNLSLAEHFDIDCEALDLIALNSNGSLRDAETILDQLSLLNKRITASLVNDLVGVVSDEKLIDLLDIALSSDTAETVRMSRELLDSGIGPMRLMCQLAGIIMDIIAGSHQLAASKSSDSVLRGRSLTEAELVRLQQALKILSDAEKQLRNTSERSTWFTAALLQLGSGHPTDLNHSSGVSSSKSIAKSKKNMFNDAKDNLANKKYGVLHDLYQSSSGSFARAASGRSSPHANTSCSPSSSMRQNTTFDSLPITSSSANDGDAYKYDAVWRKCIEECHNKILRNFLYNHGKIVSISDDHGSLDVFVAFRDLSKKSRAEGFLSSITNSLEIVLRQNVKVRIGLLAEKCRKGTSVKLNPSEIIELSNKESNAEDCKLVSDHDSLGLPGKISYSPEEMVQNVHSEIDVSMQGIDNEEIDKQHCESAWLQATEKSASRIPGALKLERNQVLPQNGFSQNSTSVLSSKHWEDELNQEIKALKIRDKKYYNEEEYSDTVDHSTLSPSEIHLSSNRRMGILDKDRLDNDSAKGYDGLLCCKCWKVKKPLGTKGKELIRVRSVKKRRSSCLGRMRFWKADGRIRRI